MGIRRTLGVLPVVLLLAACGEETDQGGGTVPPAAEEPPAQTSDGTPQLYEASGTVLEVEGESTRLCSALAESYPPQCGGGVELVGWDWSGADPAPESVGGTTWGSYTVTGGWDGERFTVEGSRPLSEPGAETGQGTAPPPEPSGRDPEELRTIQEELVAEYPEVMGAGLDERLGVVMAEVILDTPELRDALEERFGAGAVVLNSWLRPVPPEG